MTQKIDWYREVLELEPNSKVFFPFARLLAEDGQTSEAILTLQKGLDRHPEYLEARLYLIELLYRHGPKEACDEQVEKLSRMFASYAGFWQAWAACLAQDKEKADTASLLRFIAANFISGPIQLHDVINRGLASVLDSSLKKEADLPATEGMAVEQALPEPEDDLADLPATEGLAVEQALPEPEDDLADLPATEGLTVEQALPEPEDDLADLPATEGMAVEQALPEPGDDLADLPATEGMAVEQALPEPEDDLADLPATEGMAVEQALPEPEDDLADLPATEGIAVEQAFDDMINDLVSTTRLLDSTNDQNEPSTTSPAKEITNNNFSESILSDEDTETDVNPYSVRTRSMAEVLAEQGDIQGALDIYHEIAEATSDPDEVEDIARRIDTLSSKLGLGHNGSDQSSHKDKLIGMLETLAHRMEARAQN